MAQITTTRGFPFYELGDIPDGASQQKALALFLNAVAVKSDRGPRASRPPAAASNARTIYEATDTGAFFWSTGTAWLPLGPVGLDDEARPTSPIVTELPTVADSYDGLVVRLRPSVANPTVLWTLQYDQARPVGERWLCTGGAPLRTESAAGVSWGDDAYAGFTQAQQTVPVSGTYDVTASCIVSSNSRALVALPKPGTASSTWDARRIVDAVPHATGGRTFRDSVTAGQIYRFAQRMVTGNAVTSSGHSITLMPVALAAPSS